MREWLPVICDLFPGAGITVFTVWDTSVDWWLVFKARAEATIDAHKVAQRQRGTRGK